MRLRKAEGEGRRDLDYCGSSQNSQDLELIRDISSIHRVESISVRRLRLPFTPASKLLPQRPRVTVAESTSTKFRKKGIITMTFNVIFC